jgi:hypothetical protein
MHSIPVAVRGIVGHYASKTDTRQEQPRERFFDCCKHRTSSKVLLARRPDSIGKEVPTLTDVAMQSVMYTGGCNRKGQPISIKKRSRTRLCRKLHGHAGGVHRTTSTNVTTGHKQWCTGHGSARRHTEAREAESGVRH